MVNIREMRVSAAQVREVFGLTTSNGSPRSSYYSNQASNVSTSSKDNYALPRIEKMPAILANPLESPERGNTLPAEVPARPSPFPDGGRAAWLTVAGGAACMFCSFGWMNAVGIFQGYYGSHQLQGYNESEIGWISSSQIFFMLAGGFLVGKAFDDYGPRWILRGGTFMHVFGVMMLSLSHTYYQILLSTICSALGTCLIFYPAMTCVMTWFQRRRAAALGICAAGSSLGGVILPIMINRLLPKVGFGWTLRICGIMMWALMVFANVTMSSRLQPTKRPFEFAAFVRPLREPGFCCLVAGVSFFYWGMFIPFVYIVVSGQIVGMSTALAFYLVPILNGASLLGRTIPNALADPLGRYNMMIAVSALSTILILALWLPSHSNAPIIIFAALFGFSSGGGIGLIPALCAQISPIKDIGVRTGSLFFLGSFAALSGAPIGGAIIANASTPQEGIRWAAAFAGTSCAVGTAFFVVTRVLIVKDQERLWGGLRKI